MVPQACTCLVTLLFCTSLGHLQGPAELPLCVPGAVLPLAQHHSQSPGLSAGPVGSLSPGAARCQVIVFSAGLCLLCWFCSKPSLALVKCLDWVPGFCSETTRVQGWQHKGVQMAATAGLSPVLCCRDGQSPGFPGFPQGVPVTSPFKGFFHLWEELAGSSWRLHGAYLGRQSCFSCRHLWLAESDLTGQDCCY